MAKKSQPVGRTSKFNNCLNGKDAKKRTVHLQDEKMRKIHVILRIINSTVLECFNQLLFASRKDQKTYDIMT